MPQESGIVPQGPPEYWKYQTGSGILGGSNPEQMSRITTGAVGPSTRNMANQIVYVPGIGPMRLSDYGPGVKGLDVPVRSRGEMFGPAVNRMVNVNGRQVPLTGYVPGNRGADPTGGGKLDAYGNPIVPWSGQAPGGWEEPLANLQAPSETGPATSPQEFEPGPSVGPPPTYEGMTPTGPNEYRPSAGENVPTDQGFVYPTEPGQYLPSESQNIPTDQGFTYPSEAGQYYPSEGLNVPTDQEFLYPTDTGDYRGTAPANVPTKEGMAPIGPNEYLPSAGANIPTDEAIYPTGPNEYRQSSAGANIPTDENVTANLAPDAFGLSELPAEPAPLSGEPPTTYSYPAGDGSYTTLDASGKPVASAPAQPVFDVNFAPGDQGPLYGDQKKPTTFLQDLGADITDIGNVLGTSTPYNTALSGQPGFGGHPSSFTGPGGGAFWSPAGGVPLGPLGQGSHGILPWDYYGRMSKARMRTGGDATLGFGMLNTAPGNAIARFAAGGTGYGGTNMMGGTGIRGGGPARIASAYVNPNFYAPAARAEASTQKPGGGAAAGGIGGGGPGGIA